MDSVDEASNVMEAVLQQKEASIRQAAAAMPKGSPGECIECGEDSGRLVLGVCAPCRDLLEQLERRS